MTWASSPPDARPSTRTSMARSGTRRAGPRAPPPTRPQRNDRSADASPCRSREQLADDFPVRADLDRLAGPVEEYRRGIDPELVIERRHQVLRLERPGAGILAPCVGRADHPAARDPPAG